MSRINKNCYEHLMYKELEKGAENRSTSYRWRNFDTKFI